MRFGTSFKVAAVVAVMAGALGLLAYNAVETDDVCGKWGYVVKDATTCEKDPTVLLSQILGIICGLCVLSMIRGVMAYRRERNDWTV